MCCILSNAIRDNATSCNAAVYIDSMKWLGWNGWPWNWRERTEMARAWDEIDWNVIGMVARGMAFEGSRRFETGSAGLDWEFSMLEGLHQWNATVAKQWTYQPMRNCNQLNRMNGGMQNGDEYQTILSTRLRWVSKNSTKIIQFSMIDPTNAMLTHAWKKRLWNDNSSTHEPNAERRTEKKERKKKGRKNGRKN